MIVFTQNISTILHFQAANYTDTMAMHYYHPQDSPCDDMKLFSTCVDHHDISETRVEQCG